MIAAKIISSNQLSRALLYAIHFVSYEPALGPLVLPTGSKLPDWIICGGESGAGARMAH